MSGVNSSSSTGGPDGASQDGLVDVQSEPQARFIVWFALALTGGWLAGVHMGLSFSTDARLSYVDLCRPFILSADSKTSAIVL